jgi:hypothetical protein
VFLHTLGLGQRSRFLSILLTLLFLQTVWGANLEPRPVSRGFDGPIPAGMHLATDRTGAKWLLPDGMETPPEKKEIKIEYYKRGRDAGAAKAIGSTQGHKILDSAINAEETFLDKVDFYKYLPKKFAETVYTDKHSNIHAQTAPDLLALGKFGPHLDQTFLLPYIPMPEDAFDFSYISELAQDKTKNLVKFTYKGKTHYRMFIHPNYVGSYERLIKKYGIVYHYQAMTTSSPRSLLVVDPDHPKEVHWVKPSLHKKLDGSVRINHDKKVRRAVIMSEALAQIPEEARKSYNLEFMLEPASLLPAGMVSGTIFREVAPSLLEPRRGHSWLPALALKANAEGSDKTILAEMVKTSGMKAADFVREHIVRPLLYSYLSLAIAEGLPGEMHVQNFYYEVDSRGLPTGQLLFKDNDGFRFDVELALRKGRPLGLLADFDEPFGWAKYSNALGTGGEGVPFMGSWYYKLIRNVNGFETLSSYTLTVLQQLEKRAGWDKDKIQLMFDDIASEVAAGLTNRKVAREEYGFGYDRGINIALHFYREQLAKEASAEIVDDPHWQAALRKEFLRLKEDHRTSILRRASSLGPDTRFILHTLPDGSAVIEAQTTRNLEKKADPTIGFALLENSTEFKGKLARKKLEEKARGVANDCAKKLKAQIKKAS